VSEKLTDERLERLAKISDGWWVKDGATLPVTMTIRDADGGLVAKVIGDLDMHEPAQERATLMALAPELVREVIVLRAKRTELEMLCRVLRHNHWPPTKREVARARSDDVVRSIREGSLSWWTALADALEPLVEEVDDDLR